MRIKILKIVNRLFGRKKKVSPFLQDLMVRGVKVGKNCTFGANAYIGDGTGMGDGVYIASGPGFEVSIGKHCAIAHNLRIRARNHLVDQANMHHGLAKKLGLEVPAAEKVGVAVGHAVWIGDNVIILPGVTVGNGAVVGAGSIVTKNVSAFSIVAGSPAREIRKRFSPEVIATLEEVSWWDWSLERMIRNRPFFELNLVETSSDEIKKTILA